ncbi:MAG: hypothetical protein BAA04_07970 [Firmicutes bacterium ZCTH02-B6]|nr:MAG: hypothetical protein BAA04_07970 [Firmicutes bacterium ZCTH02-B6]
MQVPGGQQVGGENVVAPAPEVAFEDPILRATREELRRFVGKRVQLFVAGSTVPDLTPLDTDGTLMSVGDSLVVLRPGHGPNAGRDMRLSLHSLTGFVPLAGFDPKVGRGQAVPPSR